ncbi:MAG: VanZ family protein [Gemmatimonadetes bacterium]|nr:VanZ family protein [Gemmatimonadota bacterium]
MTWGPAALWATVLFLLSSVPDVPGPGWLVSLPAADKVAHAVLYGVLGATLAWANHRGGRDSSRAADVLVVGLGALYGASDEWHQSFVPGRDTSAADFTADVVGLAVGYVASKHFLRGRGLRSSDPVSSA